MFDGHLQNFSESSKTCFWLRNSKLREIIIQMHRRKLRKMLHKVEVVPKYQVELEDLLEELPNIHSALKEYDESITMFEGAYVRALAAWAPPLLVPDRWFGPPTINPQDNSLSETFREVRAALDDIRYLDSFARFGVGLAGGASIVVPTSFKVRG